MSRITKAILTPHLFIRDLLLKRYPIKYSELKCSIDEIVGIKAALSEIEAIDESISNTLQIDAVFTWVDSSDLEWQKKFRKYEHVESKLRSPAATDQARFENHDELYFAVDSVLKNIKWIRRIFIVTDSQIPKWLASLSKDARDKIVIVDHTEIIESQYLPTFNSHVIEANLYKIKDLSEEFIYFNDDVYVARDLSKSHFFRSNGLASVFTSNKVVADLTTKRATATSYASQNTIKLLNQHYGQVPSNLLQHTYIPLKKETFVLAENVFYNEIKRFQHNKFRSKDDINVGTFLVPWMMYFEGKALISRDICFYFNWRSNDGKAQMKSLLKKKSEGYRPDSICTNDFIKSNEADITCLSSFLTEYFKAD